MKVKCLRLELGCSALGNATFFANDANTKIDRIGVGEYLVQKNGKAVIIPGHRTEFAEVELDQKGKNGT